MKPGCQHKAWHKVLKGVTGDKARYCLSFRHTKLLNLELTPDVGREHFSSHGPAHSTPIANPKFRNPSFRCPSEVLPKQQNTPLIHRIPLPSLQPLHEGFPLPLKQSTEPAAAMSSQTQKRSCTHLILGDSLVKGLDVPNSMHICRGGIHPKQVLPLLETATDTLHPDCYNVVRTVTLIVGTNALNVNLHSDPVPFLEVIEDYKKTSLWPS